MNPLTNVKNINKLNEIELEKGTVDKKSWHDIYKESAWVFIGGLAYGLTEGDIITVFSQYGEIVNINNVRDKKTGKTKGFCFLCYANQKSTVLAVDNFNGIKLCGRTIRVDHVANYKPPKEYENEDDITKQLKAEGCAPKLIKNEAASKSEDASEKRKKTKNVHKEKKKHKKHKKKHDLRGDSSKKVKVKQEKFDPGYSKYENTAKSVKNSSTDSESSSSESSDNDSRHISSKDDSNSKVSDKERRNQSHLGKSSEKPNRNQTNLYEARKYKHKNKELSNDADCDESGKRKQTFESDYYFKRQKSDSSAHKHSKNTEENFDSSSDVFSKNCRNRTKKRSSNNDTLGDHDAANYKDESSSKERDKHHRHDSSSSSENDLSYKKDSRAQDKNKERQSHEKRKDFSCENHGKNHRTSSSDSFRENEMKYKISNSVYKDKHDSAKSNKRYDQGKYHKEDFRLNRKER